MCYAQPKDDGERRAIANDFLARFHYAIPLVIDPFANPAEAAYAAWPERLYVIGADGRISYKGAMGPDGFDPEGIVATLGAAPGG